MDEALLKSGQYPNVAIEAGTDPAEVMREHGKVIQNAEKDELADSREQLLNGICGTKSEKTPEIARQDGVLNISDVQDTREQLEADAMFDAKMLWNSADECISVIRGWLDRQAAITERKCMKQATTRYIGWDCAECAEGLGKELDARCDPLKERIAELTAERDQLSRDLDAEHALVVQFECDNEKLRDTCNTLRASVAGLKMTVERFKARESGEPADMGN